MKDFVCRLVAFVLFDMGLKQNELLKKAASFKDDYSTSGYSLTASSLKDRLLLRYWCSAAVPHFLFSFLLSVVVVFFNQNDMQVFNPSVIALTVIVCLPVMCLTVYYYGLRMEVLPGLDTAIKKLFGTRDDQSSHKIFFHNWKQSLEQQLQQFRAALDQAQENKVGTEAQNLQAAQCRKKQLPAFTLVLILYAFSKETGLDLPQVKQPAQLFTALFGLDGGYLLKQWQVINGPKRNFTARKRTENLNRFEEAYATLKLINFEAGTQHLRELETRFR